jgi:hypothetical protein
VLISAQTVNSSTNASVSIQRLIALYTQLIQLLEQEITQLTIALQNQTPPHVCPNYQQPACTNGTLVSQGNDAYGCGLPLQCVQNNSTQFSASPTSGPAPLAVNFSATNLNNSGSYAIAFGDGTRGSLQTPATLANCAGNCMSCVAHLHLRRHLQSQGYDIDFGDGANSGSIGCTNGGCDPTPTNVSADHTYQSTGTFTAKLHRHLYHNESLCAQADCNVVGTVTITAQ